jgi:hypothetical protein
MSVVQGTIVKVKMTFMDEDTGLVNDPPDVQFAYQPPSGSLVVWDYDGGAGEVTKISAGVYLAAIDTTPASGHWSYEAASSGPNAVRRKGSFPVEAKLGP